MKKGSMSAATKVKLYEEVLNRLACWDEKFSECDEPGAADEAQKVLEKTKAERYVERLDIETKVKVVRVPIIKISRREKLSQDY